MTSKRPRFTCHKKPPGGLKMHVPAFQGEPTFASITPRPHRPREVTPCSATRSPSPCSPSPQLSSPPVRARRLPSRGPCAASPPVARSVSSRHSPVLSRSRSLPGDFDRESFIRPLPRACASSESQSRHRRAAPVPPPRHVQPNARRPRASPGFVPP